MPSVLQDWVHNLTFTQQTVLLTAVRGPDNTSKYGPTKYLLRWYRRCIIRSSLDGGAIITHPWDDGRGGSFMGPSLEQEPCGFIRDSKPVVGYRRVNGGNTHLTWQEAMDDHVSDYLCDVDALPHHFQLRFMHAVEIVGYKHPGLSVPAGKDRYGAALATSDNAIMDWWSAVYRRLVHDMHLHPETEAEMDRRLGDSRDQWLERADVATVK